MQDVLNWLNRAFTSFTDWILSLFELVKSWIFDASYAVFDAVLSVFQSIITSIPVPSSWASVTPWAGLSPQALWVLDKLQIVTVLSILAAAWGIRFLMNLIPSWATRF